MSKEIKKLPTNNRSHSCYEVHKSWRKPSPQNSDSKPTACNENCPEEARKLNPLTPKVLEWEKEFWDRYADRTNLTYKLTNPQSMADFIRQEETEATQKGYERGANEATPEYKKDMEDAYLKGKREGREEGDVER